MWAPQETPPPLLANAQLKYSYVNMPCVSRNAEQWEGIPPDSEESLVKGLMDSFPGRLPKEKFALETYLKAKFCDCLMFLSLSLPLQKVWPRCQHVK